MNVWIFLWVLLTLLIVGATVWSTIILYRQKAAWEQFAKIHNLKYTRGKLMGSPTVDGQIDQTRVSLFTAQRQAENERKATYLNVLEVVLPHGTMDGGAAGTKEMIPFIQSLETLSELEVAHTFWQDGFALYVRDPEASKAFFTPERLEIMARILSLKNADILVLFDGKQTVIRIETPDPMLNALKLDKIVKRLMKDGSMLAPREAQPVSQTQ